MKKNIIIYLILATSLISCGDNDSESTKFASNQYQISFLPNINEVSLSSYNKISFGVYIKGLQENIQYRILEQKLQPINLIDQQYWSNPNQEISVLAYAPFYNEIPKEIIIKANQNIDNNYLQSDFLYASSNIINFQNRASKSLKFEHLLSRIILKVKYSNDILNTDVNNAVVLISEINTKADIDIFTGVLTNPNSITSVSALKKDGSIYSAVIIPQTISYSSSNITVKINNISYKYLFTKDQILRSGEQYSYTLYVTKSGIELISENISKWEEDNILEGNTSIKE